MQREIKFRAWWKPSEEEGNTYEGEMIQDFQIKTLIQNTVSTFGGRKQPGIEYFEQGRLLPGMGTLEHLSADEIILLQYTGLKDKNGKEIYEGDVILADWRSTPCKWKVYCDNETQYWDIESHHGILEGLYDYHKDCQVIGNIYEHPHLLEVKK